MSCQACVVYTTFVRNSVFSYPTTPHDTGIWRSVVLYCGNAKTPRVIRAKTQNFPCRWENHDWTATVQVRQKTSEKFLLAECMGSEKFFSFVVSYEKYNFRLFHCFQPTKMIIVYHIWPELLKLWSWSSNCNEANHCPNVPVGSDPLRHTQATLTFTFIAPLGRRPQGSTDDY